MRPLLLAFFYKQTVSAGLAMNFGYKKDGFTLIELIVVILVVGVLSTVAVPGLFGQMAKAKASELYSAAGSYIRLQDTYNAQNADNVGSWKTIGYSMHSGKNFKYSEGSSEGGAASATTFSIDDGEESAWVAENVTSLNDCATGSAWKIDVSKSTTAACRIDYSVSITGGSKGVCGVLTSKFTALDTHNRIVGSP